MNLRHALIGDSIAVAVLACPADDVLHVRNPVQIAVVQIANIALAVMIQIALVWIRLQWTIVYVVADPVSIGIVEWIDRARIDVGAETV